MWDFVRFAARCRPIVAAFESVRSAFSQGHSLMRALREELETLTGDQYHLYHVIHNAYDLEGVAIRPRYFWVVSKVPFGIEWPSLPERPVLWDALADLEHMPMNMNFQSYVGRPSSWMITQQSYSKTFPATVDGHITARDNPHQERLRGLFEFEAQSEHKFLQGDTIYAYMQRVYEATGKVPPSYEYDLEHLLRRNFVMGFINPKRWYADRPSRVIDGASMDRAIHPTQPRTFTHRECARIMGFPDDWHVSTIKATPNNLMATWGKGITVSNGRWLGKWIINSLEGNPGTVQGELIGERESIISPSGKSAVRSTSPQTTRTQRSLSMPMPRPAHLVDGQDNSLIQEHNMSETVEVTITETVTATDGTEAATATVKRGRPRPAATIERDEKVNAFLKNAGSRNWTIQDLAAALQEVHPGEYPVNVTKACLDRLSWGTGNKETPEDPQVIKVSRTVWRSAHVEAPVEAVVTAPAETATEAAVEAVQTAAAEAVEEITEAAAEAVEEIVEAAHAAAAPAVVAPTAVWE